MTFADIAGLILTILSITVVLGAGVRWVIKKYLQDMLHELKPNSGQSIKDQVTRLEKNFLQIEHQQKEADLLRKEMNKKIDHMYDVLLDYISRSNI
jgi:F0F1-type ATP synthase membrane subunit b/b'